MKLCNFLALDPTNHGKERERGGRLEQQIWNEFHDGPLGLRRLANSIRAGYQSESAEPAAAEEAVENEFPEGKVLYRMHRARQRNAKLVRLAKSRALKANARLDCAACGFEFAKLIIVEHGKPSETLEGERRHLTVLSCDLVGSTEIARRLDPEEWREIVAGYHRAAAQAIERFGGHVAQYLGDGVMGYFGYPDAHENDAERAVRAGLAIPEAIAKLSHQPRDSRLTARVGIDSGGVV
jgi:Adenylate and Guanylate cyclase catalytic domain